jgi:hypothetical protein
MFDRKDIAILMVGALISVGLTATTQYIEKNPFLSFIVFLALTLGVLLVMAYYRAKDERVHELEQRAFIGVANIYETGRNMPTMIEIVTEGRNEIRVLGISMRNLLAEPGMESLIREKAREGCVFRFLLLNPDSPYVETKAQDENDHPEAWVNDIKGAVSRLKILQQELGANRLEFRFYDSYPIWRGTLVDNRKAYIGYYPHGHKGKDSSGAEIINGKRSFYDPFSDYFNELWKASKTAP